mmetsp:Transcript_10588/g.25810  ORF Transcript_10588/g.25810 Transcript_10588/m.25810 type:complete len:230 (+) Transcript_10588:487-1176(+)
MQNAHTTDHVSRRRHATPDLPKRFLLPTSAADEMKNSLFGRDSTSATRPCSVKRDSIAAYFGVGPPPSPAPSCPALPCPWCVPLVSSPSPSASSSAPSCIFFISCVPASATPAFAFCTAASRDVAKLYPLSYFSCSDSSSERRYTPTPAKYAAPTCAIAAASFASRPAIRRSTAARDDVPSSRACSSCSTSAPVSFVGFPEYGSRRESTFWTSCSASENSASVLSGRRK